MITAADIPLGLLLLLPSPRSANSRARRRGREGCPWFLRVCRPLLLGFLFPIAEFPARSVAPAF